MTPMQIRAHSLVTLQAHPIYTNKVTGSQCHSIQQRVFRAILSYRLVSCRYSYHSSRSCPKPPTYATSHHRPRTTHLASSRQSTIPTSVSMTGSPKRSHGHGHGHGHDHHHHDTTYLTSKNKNDPGVRITRIGLLSNLGMAVGKGIGGYMFHSQALVADAYHALTDLVSDFMTLATVSVSLKPPSSRFPTGYGKVETLGALGVSGLLLCGGVLMGLNAMEVILTQFFPDIAEMASHWGLLGHGHSHGHGHDHEPIGPNINAAWLALGSIVVKEWLYRATMKIAKERKSSVLASNAIHHRIDSLTSIVALLTIGGAHVFTDATWLDPVGGLIISMMVIKAGWGNTKVSLLELADVGIDESMIESVNKSTVKAIKTTPYNTDVEVRSIQGVKSGPNYLIEVELGVPGSWSVERTCQIEQTIRDRVASRVRGVKRLKFRFVPKEMGFVEEFIAPDISPRSSPEPEAEVNGVDEAAASSSLPQQDRGRRRN